MNAPETFSLGTLIFDAWQFEVPADLKLGKTTLGGIAEIPQTDGQPAQRVSQTQGVVCDKIAFDAWFIGPDAEARADQLESLQLAQSVLRFRRGTRSYDVVIFHIELLFHSSSELNFSIELEPLAETNAAGGKTTGSAAQSVADNESAINALLAAAPANIDTFGFDNTQATIDQITALGPPDQIAIPDLNDAIVRLVAQIDYWQVVLDEIDAVPLPDDLRAQSIDVGPADVQTYLYVASLMGGLAGLSKSLGLFAGSASSPVAPGGMNAYQFAVRYTGNVDNADAILAANHLTDPFQLGSAPLVIPHF